MAGSAEVKRLRKLSVGALADEVGALKERTEAIKDEAIRRGLRKAEGALWKLALSPPGTSNRTDRALLLQVMGLTENEYLARFHDGHPDGLGDEVHRAQDPAGAGRPDKDGAD